MRALSLAAILALGFLTTFPAFAQTTFVVTKTADTNDGTCDADCSLREAIEAAEAAAGDDLIRFDPALDGQSIFPTSAYTINTNVEIDAVTGLSDGITIDAGLQLFTVVQVFPLSGPPNTVTLAGLTLSRSQNGALFNDGILTVDQCTISDNTAGAIQNEGTLVVKNSTLSGNAATTIDRSTLFNLSGDVTVLNSTFSGNTTSSISVAAAIQSNPSGSVTVRNSTFSGNTHTLGQISGILGGTVTVGNTVFDSGGGANLGLGTITSEGFNICDDACGLTGTSDQTSTDPQLGPLADNGGPNLTHTLLTGSPAIDIGGTCGPEDQRGESAPVPGTFGVSATCDAGAVEIATPPPPATLVVNTLAGDNDGICGLNGTDPLQDCSLLEAVALANTSPDANTITFAVDGDVSPTSGVVISTPVTLDGTTAPSGAHSVRILGAGLTVTGASAANSVIEGLVIGNAPVFAVRLEVGVTGVQVRNNFIGTDPTEADLRNGDVLTATGSGIVIGDGASDNTIGGSTLGEGNTIGFTRESIVLQDAGTTGNAILGNFVGTNAAGANLATTENGQGLSLVGVAIRTGASGNTIGASSAGAANTFGYLRSDGILIEDAGTTGNAVQGNFIGTNAAGANLALAFSSGVYIRNAASDNSIGGTGTGEGNTIGFSGGSGVLIQFANTTGNTVLGNFIGTNAAGTNLGNKRGVFILGGASNNIIGGSAPGAANIIGFSTENGVQLQNEGTSGNHILGNYIGTNANGDDLGNGFHGVGILFGPSNNTIGGTGAGEGNVIGFNDFEGIQMGNSGASPTGNVIAGNFIGTDASGANLGNGRNGIALGGGVNTNTFGGTDPGAGNTIGFNGAHGIRINNNNTVFSASVGNVIRGNFVGTNAAGADLGNGADGILLDKGAQSTTVGGVESGAGNTVGFNGGSGIVLANAGTSSNTVLGNFVGTNASGANLGNTTQGILIAAGATNNTIGGANAGEGNTVGFNGLNGIRLEGSGTSNNTVRGNLVGTDATGADLGNTGKGISVASGASNNTIGGTGAGEGNTVGFSSQDGIEVAGNGTSGNTVQGNFVGTNAAGTDLGNTNFGVTLIFGASDNTVGGAAEGAANTIGFHGLAGVYLNDTSTGNTVLGNFVGTNAAGDDLGNDGNGVQLFNAPNNTIGGTGADDGNTIANNGVGINVEGEPAVGNALLGNRVFDNTGLGIDLLPFGVAANDGCTDADVGPNGLQNFPVLGQAIADGGTTTIDYDLDTAAGTYRVEFFSVTTADASGNGEGRTFLGAQDVTVSAGCGEAFQFMLPTQLATTLSITATATPVTAGSTPTFGGTSEFSAAVAVRLPVGTIGDFVFNDLNGDGVQDAGEGGIEGVTLFLDANGNDELDDAEQSATTDASGAYDLTDVVAGTYTVKVDTTTVPEGFVLTTGNDPLTVELATLEDFNDADFGYQFVCAPGFFLDPDDPLNCLPAPPGTFVAAEQATAQTPCALGTFQPEAGQSMCLPAPVGSYVDMEEATSATSCPASTTTDGEGATSASACVAITAQTFMVTKTDDTNDGTCDADCSLREAIAAADANVAAAADTISFSPAVTGTIALGGSHLVLGTDVVIEGPGSTVLAVSGNGTSRVFETTASVEIRDLTITGGLVQAPSSDPGATQDGGGIHNTGTLTLSRCVVSENAADGSGGGIINAGGTLVLRESTVTENAAGGIVQFDAATLTVSNSTISNNTGDGIHSNGFVDVTRSTFHGNEGSGIAASGSSSASSEDVIVSQSTFSGNVVGIGLSSGGRARVTNSTFRDNGTTSISLFIASELTIGNSIIDTGATGTSFASAGSTITSLGYNVCGDACGLTGPGDLTETNPLLDVLADNGGLTPTHALLPGSPAIDIGGTCGPTDQRGFEAPIIGRATNSTALCDAGSFETEILDAEPPTVMIASTLDDPTATQPIPLTFTFSEAVSDFSADDIDVIGGTLGAVTTTDSTTFAADLTPDGAGEITVDIDAGVATDLAGNPNEAADTFSITFDNEGPTDYTAAFDQNAVNATNETAASFTISEAEEGASFVYTITSDGGAGEVTGSGIVGSAAPRLPGGANDLARGNKGGGFELAPLSTTMSEQVTGIDVSGLPDGTLTLSVTLTDPLGNTGAEATDTTDKDTVAPAVTIATTTPEPTVKSPFPVTITFSEAISGFTEDDIDVTNGTLSDFDDSGAPLYTASVTPDEFGEVTIAVNAGVATDDAGNGNTAAEPLVRTFVQQFNLTLATDFAFTGPGTGTLTALVTNTGSELATRVRVKITKTFDVATGPKQLVIGAIAPGETGTAVFDFGSAGDNAEVRLKAEDLVVRDEEENFDDNRTIVFLVPGDGGADVTPPEITGALSGQVFAGTVEENRINDTGVASVVLDPGAVNLTLVVDPFGAGATVVSYTATPIDPMQDATGTVRATDVEGNADTRPVSIPRTPPPPPTETLLVRLTPDDAPVFIGNGGGSFTFTGEVTNPTDGRLTQDVWLVLIDPSGLEEVQFGPFRVRLGAGGMTSERFTVTVDREAEAGVYAYEGRAGDFPGTVTDTDRFTFEKLGDGSRQAEPLASGRMTDAMASDTASVLPVLTTTAGLVWGITDDAEWAALGEDESSEHALYGDGEPATTDTAAAKDDALADATDADKYDATDAEEAVADETTSDARPSAADASREGARETEQTDESGAMTTEAPLMEAAQVETTSVALPDDLALNSVYPNPFTHRATVEVALPEPTDLSVTVYDLTSRLVATLAQGTLEAGYHTLELHGAVLSSGVYLVRLATADGTTQTRRITLVR